MEYTLLPIIFKRISEAVVAIPLLNAVKFAHPWPSFTAITSELVIGDSTALTPGEGRA